MKQALMVLVLSLFVTGAACADPDDLSGGVLLVHAPPSLTYTTESASWCDSTYLENCEDQVTTLPADSSATVVWYILSAWGEEKTFTAVEFGLGDFNPESFLFSETGLCLDHAMTINHGNWPGPNTGVAIASNEDAWTGQLVPIYWLACINYLEADTLALTVNPATDHAGWISESMESFDAECLGALGLGAVGIACCPAVGFDQADTSEDATDEPPVEQPGAQVLIFPCDPQAYDPESFVPGRIPLVNSQISFDVAPENRLYLNGHRIQRVSLAVDSIGTLFLNDAIIYPSHRVDQPHSFDPWENDVDHLRRLYSSIPFVQDLVSKGDSWNTAVQQYYQHKHMIMNDLRTLYADAALSMDTYDAMESTAQRVFSADSLGLLESAPAFTGETYTLSYRGDPARTRLPVGAASVNEVPPSPEDLRTSTVHQARVTATDLFNSLSRLSVTPCIISICYATRFRHCSSGVVLRAEEQIGRVSRGEDPAVVASDGPLGNLELTMIRQANW